MKKIFTAILGALGVTSAHVEAEPSKVESVTAPFENLPPPNTDAVPPVPSH